MSVRSGMEHTGSKRCSSVVYAVASEKRKKIGRPVACRGWDERGSRRRAYEHPTLALATLVREWLTWSGHASFFFAFETTDALLVPLVTHPDQKPPM